MDPLTERVFEDSLWLVILMAMIAFFWFHDRGKRQSNPWNEGAAKDKAKAAQAAKKTM